MAYPFWGDQALHQVIARMMSDGATLYVDAWDAKQPGLFLIHLAAGELISFDAIAVHSIEAVYLIGSSVLLAFGLRRHLERGWIAGLLPIAGAAWFFMAANARDLSQAEVWLSPLVGGIALALVPSETLRGQRWQAALAGVLAGLIIWLKGLALVIPATLLVVSYIRSRRETRSSRWSTAILVPFVIGAIVPASLLGLWITANEIWPEVWYTWIVLPLEIEAVRPLRDLVINGGRFIIFYAGMWFLAAFALLRRRETVVWLLLAALASGLGYVLVQFWWTYLFYILMAPLALLALIGLDRMLARSHKRVVAYLVTVALCLPVGLLAASKSQRLLDFDSLSVYQSGFEYHARSSQDASGVVVESGETVWVMGNPIIHEVLPAPLGMPINGSSAENWPDSLWEMATEDLASAEVDHVFVSWGFQNLIEAQRPEFVSLLNSLYEPASSTESGTWFRLE